jgi:hypothetical protein
VGGGEYDPDNCIKDRCVLSVFLAIGFCSSPCPGDTSGAARSTVTAFRDCHLVEPFRRCWHSTTSPVIDTAAATTTGGTWPCAGFAEKAGASFDKRLIQIIAARSARLTTAAGKRRAILAVASQQKKKD